MARFHTQRELLEIAMRAFYTNNPEIDPDVVRREGSDANLLAASAAAVGGAVSLKQKLAFDGLFILSAHGADLDTLIMDHYGLPRNEASSSLGTLRFTRTSAVAGAVSMNPGFRVRTTGQEIVTVETLGPVAFGVGDLGPHDVDAISVDTGLSQNVKAGKLTVPDTALPDGTILVTNQDLFAGGADRESDDHYRMRGIRFWKDVVKGTLGAIENGALTVAGISEATATELLTPEGIPYGVVSLVVGDQEGNGNDAMLAQFTGIGQGVLKEYKCGGVYVITSVGAQLLVEIELEVTFAAGVNTTEKIQLIKLVVAAHVNVGVSGQTLERATIIKAAKSVQGVFLADGGVLVPGGDLVPLAHQRIMTTTALVRVNGQ